ncbi:hypothetical protein GJ496_004900 [Pomphorhynchus laevis]|nr:hypothetical protein GJ496_004900 [Pomphorhynchus laevis]
MMVVSALYTQYTYIHYNTDFVSISNDPFTKRELETCIRPLSNHKAVGSDNVSIEHLKATFHLLGDYWTSLFNSLFMGSEFPASWKVSVLKMLYNRTGSRENQDSYRGIAISNHTYKHFSTLLTRRLISFGELVLPDSQHGFRPMRSTNTALKIVKDIIFTMIWTSYGHAYGIFVDFRKTFGTTHRDILLHKLRNYFLMHGPILNMITKVLSSNYIRISNGVSLSNVITQLVSVPQGDPLSPVIFSLFVADVER